WPREHGRMLGHRVNSEGLRRRAIAPSGGAPKRPYIGFGAGFCQPFRGAERLKKQSFFAVSGARAKGHTARRRCRFAIPTSLRGSAPEFCDVLRPIRRARRTAATFLRRSLVNSFLSSQLRG